MFKRDHHKIIAFILQNLKAPLLKARQCYFGGGTAIVLKNDEYRESVDIDFLISCDQGYRDLRQLVKMDDSLLGLFEESAAEVIGFKNLRVDQYGIRSLLQVMDQSIKFEIVHEGRVQFEKPGANDVICDITTLSDLDLLTSKILANSDRWADRGVFSRDIIDLAMMEPEKKLFMKSFKKASEAYGNSAGQDLQKAIHSIRENPDYLARCCEVLAMYQPPAEVWQKMRRLERWVK